MEHGPPPAVMYVNKLTRARWHVQLLPQLHTCLHVLAPAIQATAPGDPIAGRSTPDAAMVQEGVPFYVVQQRTCAKEHACGKRRPVVNT